MLIFFAAIGVSVTAWAVWSVVLELFEFYKTARNPKWFKVGR